MIIRRAPLIVLKLSANKSGKKWKMITLKNQTKDNMNSKSNGMPSQDQKERAIPPMAQRTSP
jgi:hypothetical protein